MTFQSLSALPHLDEEGLPIAVAPGEDGVDGGWDAPAFADPAGVGGRRAPAIQQPVVVTYRWEGTAARMVRHVGRQTDMGRKAEKSIRKQDAPVLPLLTVLPEDPAPHACTLRWQCGSQGGRPGPVKAGAEGCGTNIPRKTARVPLGRATILSAGFPLHRSFSSVLPTAK